MAGITNAAGRSDSDAPSPFSATVLGPDGEPVTAAGGDAVSEDGTDETGPASQADALNSDAGPESLREVRYLPGDTVHVRVSHPDYHTAEMVVETDRLTASVDIDIQLTSRTN